MTSAVHDLLAGYVTGTLSPIEREELARLALEDREVFEAMGDMTPLRLALADPAFRERSLAELEGVSARPDDNAERFSLRARWMAHFPTVKSRYLFAGATAAAVISVATAVPLYFRVQDYRSMVAMLQTQSLTPERLLAAAHLEIPGEADDVTGRAAEPSRLSLSVEPGAPVQLLVGVAEDDRAQLFDVRVVRDGDGGKPLAAFAGVKPTTFDGTSRRTSFLLVIVRPDIFLTGESYRVEWRAAERPWSSRQVVVSGPSR